MEAFAAAVGCGHGNDAEVLACLRALPAEQIMRHAQQPDPTRDKKAGGADWVFGAVVDGDGGVLPAPPRRFFDQGDIADVPYLLGTNDDEGRVAVFNLHIADQAAYKTEIEHRFPGIAADVLAHYPATDFDGDYQTALAAAIGDGLIICDTADTAQEAATAGLSVYLYNFDIPWAIAPDVLGAAHAAEISHVFGNPIAPDTTSRAVSEAMTAYWTHFASTGNPNHRGAPATWPTYAPSEGNSRRLQLDARYNAVDDLDHHHCAFWHRHRSALTNSP
jgi:para-nitrobenzyl esterase